MNSFIDKISEYIRSLDDDSSAALQNISFESCYKKGEFLLRQNETYSKGFLIISGIARKYYLNDGKEITTELFFANDLALCFSSYTFQQPSRESIQALTDVSISITNHQTFQEAKMQHSQLVTLYLMLAEYYAMWLEKRLFEFHTMTATQRYRQIPDRDPYIIQTLPLTIIASYLGISLETLSRIRAQI